MTHDWATYECIYYSIWNPRIKEQRISLERHSNVSSMNSNKTGQYEPLHYVDPAQGTLTLPIYKQLGLLFSPNTKILSIISEG